MKLIIGGIIGGVIGSLGVLGIVMLFPMLSDTPEEIIEIQTIHPCQESTLEIIFLTTKYIESVKSSTDIQELDVLRGEYDKSLEQLQQLMIDNNCEELRSVWSTDEFEEKIKLMIDSRSSPGTI